MSEAISQSEFYMWRTLFALAHADGIVTQEEIRFMAESLEDNAFSEAQKDVLTDDISNPKKPSDMFSKIEDVKDQARFFKFAQKFVWIDGKYAPEEEQVMTQLISAHMREVDFESLVEQVDMEWEESASVGDGGGIEHRRSFIRKFYDLFAG